MKWPTTKDGVVDWDLVFTRPNTGFISMVQQADTPEKLKSCVHVVISSLFTRDDDLKYAKAYLATLDRVFEQIFTNTPAQDPSESLILARTKAINLLTSIQHNRKSRAEEYLKLKASGDERRLEADDPMALLTVLEADG